MLEHILMLGGRDDPGCNQSSESRVGSKKFQVREEMLPVLLVLLQVPAKIINTFACLNLVSHKICIDPEFKQTLSLAESLELTILLRKDRTHIVLL